ncbi:MAG: hypothetical protein RLP44_01110 [Aggregatilineales bacterium]
MADDKQILRQAATALRNEDKAEARRILKPILQANPTADAWFLAANAMETDEQAIACLKKAIALDSWHANANRMLLKLEGTKTINERIRDTSTQEVVSVSPTATPLPKLKRKPRATKVDTRAARRRMWTRVGCVSFFVVSFSCSVMTFSLIGLVPGVIGAFIQATGGPPPVTEFDGVPIEDVQNAALFIEPAVSEQATDRQVNVLEHGYVHEYSFDARAGDEYAIYIQFMSFSSTNVDGNTLVIDPNGDLTNSCVSLGESGILGGEGNITIECQIGITGTWHVRVVGINGESVGAYFAGVERIAGF